MNLKLWLKLRMKANHFKKICTESTALKSSLQRKLHNSGEYKLTKVAISANKLFCFEKKLFLTHLLQLNYFER